MHPILLAAAFRLLADTTTPAPPAAPVPYSGRAGQTRVAAPRIEETIVVDGKLDEPVWAKAALLTGFSQFSPQDGIASADSTEVLVWYSPSAIHFGIRAFEKHGAVHATHADRDKIFADDNVQIMLGTFNDRRQAMLFGVNPFGVQMDGTITERGQPLGNAWNGAQAARIQPELNQDFVFQSKGRLTDYGYEVEIRIPFKSLKYQSAKAQQWDLNIVRDIQHAGAEDSWTPARRANPTFLGQAGVLSGLHDMSTERVLDLNPILTEKMVGAPGAKGWAYDRSSPQVGLNARWGITNNLTLSGSAHPDFAEVESDAGKLVQDPRLALAFPEKRPFFLDGAENFIIPFGLIYTRRIVQPVAALKLSGKASGMTIGVLSAVDDPSQSPSGRDNPIYNILRLQRDIGRGSRLGIAYTDKETAGDFNRVADIDGRFVFGGPYAGTLQYAGSMTRSGSKVFDGSLWSGVLTRTGTNYGFRYLFSGTSPTFRASSGFLPRTGTVHAAADNHWTWLGERGSIVDNFTAGVLLDGIWQTPNFFNKGDVQDKKLHLNLSSTLRGGWALGGGMYWETFGYDDALYAKYRIQRTVGSVTDTIPFDGFKRIMNRDMVFTLSTPRFSSFSGSLLYLYGQDENFYEWAQADIHYVSAAVSFRPTPRVRVDATYDYQDYWRRSDHSMVGKDLIPRLKLEYQITRSVFVRAVGELDVSEHDDLRDETRTGFPLIISGKRALASKSQTFNSDFLFSYQPIPGTVFFFGYGGQADGQPDDRHRFVYQHLIRDNDHFFLKASYLFRM